jgi:hypothetical protein
MTLYQKFKTNIPRNETARPHRYKNEEIRTEAAQFLFGEYINTVGFSLQCRLRNQNTVGETKADTIFGKDRKIFLSLVKLFLSIIEIRK